MYCFTFRTLEDVTSLSIRIAALFDQPARARSALHELMLNAVEHGNLGITYAEKTRLVTAGQWVAEVEKRLALEEFAQREAQVKIGVEKDKVEIEIVDAGEGFDWQSYMDFCTQRASDLHGRGIAIARSCGVFDEVRYVGKGNKVICRGSRSANSDFSANGLMV